MKLSTSDSFKVFLRFFIPLAGYGFAVLAWGVWWVPLYSLILTAALLIAREIRIRTHKDLIPLMFLVLPGTIIAEIAVLLPNLALSQTPTIGLDKVLFSIFYLGITIFALTNLRK
jgi:uncharacterized membrane protein YjjP (DUF1212 family)